MVLDLDPFFHPVADSVQVLFETFTFSGGEPHIRIQTDIEPTDHVTITHRINSFNDMGLFLVAVDAVKRMKPASLRAIVPYFPAARQDRLMVTGEALTVKVYAELFNQLELDEILLFDPHSDVTPALLNQCRVVSNHAFIQSVINQLNQKPVLVSPDGGALKKVYKLAQQVGGAEVVECSKTRDVLSGQLSGFKVYSDDLLGKTCLVVDDICDGGGTFLGLARELKAKGAGALHLAVSHGIFSKGVDSLAQEYDRIFTTDSIQNLAHEKLTQIPMQSFLNDIKS